MDILQGEASVNEAYSSIVLLALIMSYNIIIGNVMNFVNAKANIYYRKKLHPLMVERVASLEYKHIENQQTADLINRVVGTYPSMVLDMYIKVLDVVDLIIYILGIIITLFKYAWIMALIVVLSSIPLVIIANKAGQNSYEAQKEMTKVDRRFEYISDVLKSRESAEERTIFGYSEALNQEYAKYYNHARKFRLCILRKNFIKSKLGSLFCSIFSIVSMLGLLPLVVNNKINVGIFIALTTAIWGLTNRLSWGINGLIEDLSGKNEYLRELSEFTSLEILPDSTCAPQQEITFKKLEFRNVSFRYPNTENWILKNLSFVIEEGKHYSFVGVNGAGKTTITKLITGLYTEYNGEILVDDRSLKDFKQEELKALSSVVYQDFAKYSISLYDNIAIADQYCCSRDKVQQAIQIVGLSDAVNRLTFGLDTPLGKIFENGVDISGGEWQRVALARSVCSRAPLRILDEPTAALDPVGESMVYQNFKEISKGLTTIFISHRLGSTKLADVIYVISDGTIVETGSHQDLISKNKLYAELYRSQSEWYVAN